VFERLIDKLMDAILNFDIIENPSRTVFTGAGGIVLGVLLYGLFGPGFLLVTIGLALVGLTFIGVGVYYLPEERRQKYKEDEKKAIEKAENNTEKEDNYKESAAWVIWTGVGIFLLGVLLFCFRSEMLDDAAAWMVVIGIAVIGGGIWYHRRIKKENAQINKKDQQ